MLNKLKILFALISLPLFMSIAYAATPEVLDVESVANAEKEALIEDTKIFDSIGMGIALSIAQCEGQDICDATVDESELEEIIGAIDRRIEAVIARQQAEEGEYTEIITAYVDTKERYNGYMEELSKITRTPELDLSEDGLASEDIFNDEDALTEDEYSAFEDFDENLEDDEDLSELDDFEQGDSFEKE